MRLIDFDRHLKTRGCSIIRQGGNHTIYFNPENRKTTAVPRHREIKNVLVKAICKQLEIASPFN
ncbi:MAG: type II toxin-antitoxin system HicA family toxin [Hydrotalea sp. AMD]|uniref:type II toxin-antitoxin system HicA family toxin n=1 Tax=Hydrotalea sp. AMD TaxID=2501297 RepID=UPI00102522A8|nr:MAG: type II toxin-antitoxin system HicA family toxin [Hydrotalea sp. AMD]